MYVTVISIPCFIYHLSKILLNKREDHFVIGDHECSNMPPSSITENGNSMIADDAMVLTLQ